VDEKEKKMLYNFVKSSDIYDKKLKMYKTSESILSQPYSIGRIRAFTPGWLENESVFMHMEFKYLLEIIKSGMLDEFYNDIKTMLPPYMDYKVYGRSILENSSFIVSSSNSNPELHGRGFYARLSGTTAEFLSMWKHIFIGDKLFTIEDGELTFIFNPKLSKEFFDNGVIEFKLFSKTLVKYKSTNLKDKISKIELFVDGKKHEIKGNKVKGELAHKIRNKEVDEIICYFE
jgi:cellobiose phosphorylase